MGLKANLKPEGLSSSGFLCLKACWKWNVLAKGENRRKMTQIPMLLSWKPDLQETSFWFLWQVESVNWKTLLWIFNPLSTGQSKIGRRRPIKLDNHCFFISQRISTNKISLERSFPYLNVDTLFLKIGQEMTPLQLFEVTQLIDFGVDRSTNVTRGRDFAHCIAMVTRKVLEC